MFFLSSRPGRRIWRGRLLVAATIAIGIVAPTAQSVRAQELSPRGTIELISDKRVAPAGATFWLALKLSVAAGWHTYWKNPGDSGDATRITWKLPKGFEASSLRWPIPEAIPVGPMMNYGYSGEVLLLSEIRVPAEDTGSHVISADVSWLACQEVCIPENGSASIKVDIGDVAEPSPHAPQLAAAVARLPQQSPWQANLSVEAGTAKLMLLGAGLDPAHITTLRFFPDEWGVLDHAAPQPLSWNGTTPTLSLQRGDLKDKPMERLSGLVVVEEKIEGAAVRHGFEIATAAANGAGESASPSARAGEPADSSLSLWQAVLFALFGGAILNLMPCVFPVLSMKAVAVSAHGGLNLQSQRRQGLAYLAGVLTTFSILAAALILLRASGLALGWGFQFQSPAFVLTMAALFFALGLSLSGVFLIGTSITNIGSSKASTPGLIGSFFTGVLASVAATPCTAPFMGGAIGFALSQPAIITVAVILALGIGFALPMVALSFSSVFARLLPRPGAWMETMKQALAFPLYASAGWMVWVLSLQSGSGGVLAAIVVLLAVGFAAWLLGEPTRVGLASKIAAACVVIAAGLYSYRQLDTQSADTLSPGGHETAERFSQRRLDELLAQGKPVFVNFTAAWCITCKVNERMALSSAAFFEALRSSGTTYLKGDWTKQDPEITSVLQKFGRAGVPLYLHYSGSGSRPEVLPQLLSESSVPKQLTVK